MPVFFPFFFIGCRILPAPNAPIEWNFAAIKKDYSGPTGFSDADIRTNITSRYSASECYFGPYTSDSIMHITIKQSWYTWKTNERKTPTGESIRMFVALLRSTATFL